MGDGEKERQQFRRLSISDLLVLTLAISISLASYAPRIQNRLRLKSPDSSTGNLRWQDVSRDVSDCTANGIWIFGLLILSRERFSNRLKSLSPGQWFFVVAGPMSVLTLIAGILRQSLLASEPDMRLFINAMFAFGIGIALVLSARALIATALQWRVCLAFIFLAQVLVAAMCVWDVGQLLGWWLDGTFTIVRALIASRATAYLLVAITAYAAVAVDIYKRISRDWLHYMALVPITLRAFSYVMNVGTVTYQWWQGLGSYLWSMLQ